MKHSAYLILGLACLCVFAGGVQAGGGAESRYDLYQAQARQYVADRTMAAAPRTRYVSPRMTYVDQRPVRQQLAEAPAGRVDVVRNASYHAPAETVIVTDIVDEDIDRVNDGVYDDESRVAVSRAYNAAPQAYAGYNAYNRYPTQRTYTTTYVDTTYASSYYDRPAHTTVYYSNVDCYPSYRRVYYRPDCGPRYGGYYRSGWGGYHGRHGGWGHYRGRGHGYYRGGGWGRRCGTSWGVSVHFRF